MKRCAVTLAVFLALGISLETANAIQPACSLTLPPLQVPRANIFTEQQEQRLGEAQADMVEPRYLLLTSTDSEYLTEIGQRLLAQLPATSIHYTFRIFESGDVRTFSLAGGHVYVSRKLILEAHSEDELAAMLAQEIGRAYTHHAASVVTLRLSKMMDVKSLGNQADIVDKFQKLLNIPPQGKAQLNENDQRKDQFLADRVGLYALIKAGYAPKAFTDFLDRVNLNGGFTGNFFTELFDSTPEVSERIGKAQKDIASFAASCKLQRRQYRPQFQAVQQALTEQKVNALVPTTPNLMYIKLDPPMSPALENVRLSPDGKYVLAQDELQVHVLSTEPLKFLFSIDAPEAQMAQFTPDSANVVFNYDTLRVENWSIATRQSAGILDFADYIGCLQTSLSPDGNTLGCFSLNGDSVWIRATDLRTGNLIFQNMDFYSPNLEFQPASIAMRYLNGARQAAVAWSQDGRYFLAASGTSILGFDMKEKKPMRLGNTLSRLFESRFAFVDSNKLLFDCDWTMKSAGSRDRFTMCYATFPDGQLIKTFAMGNAWFAGITSGDRVLAGPSGDGAASLLDPATMNVGQTFKLETVDLRGDTIAEEADRGGVSVGKLGGPLSTVAVPVTPLPSLETASFSADGRYLAISDRARGAVWDLSTGKLTAATRPFRSAVFDSQGKLQARFADHELKPARDSEIDLRTHKYVSVPTIAAEDAQYGSVVVRFKPLEQDETTDRNVMIEGFDAVSGKALWSRRFAHNAPTLVQTSNADQLLLVMDRRSETGGDEASHNKKLLVRTADEVKEHQERGLLVEAISSRTGDAQRLVLAPAIPASTNSDDRSAALFGDLLAVRGGRNNTVVYRASDGARLMGFFGRAIAGDAGLGLIAATNRAQDVLVYDVATGKELEHFTLDNYPMAARIIPEKHRLLVFTASQRVYVFDLPTTGRSSAGRPNEADSAPAKLHQTSDLAD